MANTIQLNKTISTEGIDETISINVPMYDGFKAEDLYILGQILHANDVKEAKLPKLPDFPNMQRKIIADKKTENKLESIINKATVEAKRDYAKEEKRVEQAFKDTYNRVDHLDTHAKINDKLSKLLYVECPHCKENVVMKADVNTQEETTINCINCKQPVKVSPLVKMAKIKYACECGGTGFMHFANTTTTDLPLRDDDQITLDCVKCKQPIDLFYNSKRNQFEQSK